MPRALVIGYGNLNRNDDGVAYYVVNALRARLGQSALTEDSSGLETLGAHVDAVFLTQLVPELVDVMADYDLVVFVDAHVYPQVPDLYCEAVQPTFAQRGFTHHMAPESLLALLLTLRGQAPAGHVVSIRGHDFDFGQQLSPATGALVEAAAEKVLLLVGAPAGQARTIVN